jgi:hypothetical protein
MRLGAAKDDFYEVRPRKDHRGVNLISDALPFGRLWYTKVSHGIEYAKRYSRSHDAVIRVCDDVGSLIEPHEHTGKFIERGETRISQTTKFFAQANMKQKFNPRLNRDSKSS